MASRRVNFHNEAGTRLAGIIELPVDTPRAFAIFCHCFTCTKDLKAIVKISRGLARHGIGVLRFDFSGLGDSGGDFSETNFETNIADILSASHWLNNHHQAPKLLLGLSLGGAAIMAAAGSIESAVGVVTLAAPANLWHLADFLNHQNPEIEAIGIGSVTIGGRSHMIKSQLLSNLRTHDLVADIRAIRIHQLIFQSPQDETISFDHAEKIFELTGGIKSFVTMDGADHLLVEQPNDGAFVADQIALWSQRFL